MSAEIAVLPTTEWVCIQKNCDGVHHVYVRIPDDME